MDSASWRLQEAAADDAASIALVQQLAQEEEGVSQHSIIAMVQSHLKRSDNTARRAPAIVAIRVAPSVAAAAGSAASPAPAPAAASPTAAVPRGPSPPLRRRKRSHHSQASAMAATAGSLAAGAVPDEPAAKQARESAVDPAEEDFATMLASMEEAFDEPAQPEAHSRDVAAAAASSLDSSAMCDVLPPFDHGVSLQRPASTTFSAYSPSFSSEQSSPLMGSSPYSPRDSRMSGASSGYSPAHSLPPSLSPSMSRHNSVSSQRGGLACHSRWFSCLSRRQQLTLLPTPLMSRVLLFLDAPTLAGLSRACRSMTAPSNDWRLWSTQFVRRWPVSTPRLQSLDWKRCYRDREAKELGQLLHQPETGATSAARSEADDPLAAAYRAMHRAKSALASTHSRQRNEFEDIEAWAREHRQVFHEMQRTPGGVEAHMPRCSRETCSYTFYAPDLYICNATGAIHFCGPHSNFPSAPVQLPSAMEARQLAKGAVAAVTSLPFAASDNSASAHPCAFLDPSTSSSAAFQSALLATRGRQPLHCCPISLRVNDSDSAPLEESAEEEVRGVRGGSPEPEEQLGRGSFLAACFEHGYNAGSLGDAAQVWSTSSAGAANSASGHRQQRAAEQQVMQRGRLFGLALGTSSGSSETNCRSKWK